MKIPLTGDVKGMNDCEEEEWVLVLFLTRAKYMLVFEYSHVCTRRAQRTVIDVIVRGNWLPSLYKQLLAVSPPSCPSKPYSCHI